ncbi:ABC transporter substrate-binding protein [Halovivax cerinus]|uniref:ABC transporter substrate-binding protein n=1 Tax=Halovivax cerinus TaxID=1487865 RepID=A0ABD5NRB6_9EURY|nr:ABC transporter substrate-binding protein [Halovivax cerinus]
MGNDSDILDGDPEITTDELSGPVIDRRTTMKLLGVAGLTGLAGCTGGDDPDDGGSGGSPQQGGTLSAGWNVGQFDQIDPHYSTSTYRTQLLGNIFSGLVEIKSDYTVQGDLATDWEVTDGGQTITFTLVEDATFHNGDDFTAEDVKYSFERVIDNETPHTSKFSSLRPVDDGGITTNGEYELELNFSEAFAPILVFLTPDLGNAGAIVSQSAIEEQGEDQFKITPVGTGPFRVAEHELGSTLVLEAHDGYHKTDDDGEALPYLDTIELEPLAEATTRTNAITSGDVSFVNWVPSSQAPSLENSPEVTVEDVLGVNFGGLAFNTRTEPFDSRDVRVGIAKVIDRDRYVESAFRGLAVPDTGIYSPAHEWVYRDEYGESADQKPPTQRYDLEGGRELLSDIEPPSDPITIMIGPPNARKGRVLRGILNNAIGDLGWEFEVESFDQATIFERLSQGQFECIPFGNSVAPDPDELTHGVFGPLETTNNFWGYEGVADLAVEQRTQLDREERKQTLWELEDNVIEDAPYALCEHEQVLSAHRDDVNGYTHYGFVMRFRDVWLDG